MKLKNLFKKEEDKNIDNTDVKSVSNDKKSNNKIIQNNKKVTKEVKKDEKKPSRDSLNDKKKNNKQGLSNDVLIKPLVTEKGATQAELGKYLFMVAKKSNKIMIAQAIEETYGVKVDKVNILNYKGKSVRYGKVQGKRKDWKKAVVTLKKGETLDVYKGV